MGYSTNNRSTFKEIEVDISEIDKIIRFYSIAQITHNAIQTKNNNISVAQNRQSDILSVKYENDSFESKYSQRMNAVAQKNITANNLVDNRQERQDIQQINTKSFINAVIYPYPQSTIDNRSERVNTDLQQVIFDKRLQYILINFISSLTDSLAYQNLINSKLDNTYTNYSLSRKDEVYSS